MEITEFPERGFFFSSPRLIWQWGVDCSVNNKTTDEISQLFSRMVFFDNLGAFIQNYFSIIPLHIKAQRRAIISIFSCTSADYVCKAWMIVKLCYKDMLELRPFFLKTLFTRPLIFLAPFLHMVNKKSLLILSICGF